MNKVIKKTIPPSHSVAFTPPGYASEHGRVRQPLILSSALFLIAAVAMVFWFTRNPLPDPAIEKPLPIALDTTSDPALKKAPARPEADAEGLIDLEDEDSGGPLPEATRIEVAPPSVTTSRKERILARTNYGRMKHLLKELRAQGLEGEALYDAAADRLVETYGPDLLMLLKGHRSLEQKLAEIDPDAMGPEERFDYIHQARLHAFGREATDSLFFETEAYARNNLEEKAILKDTSLTEEEQQEKITGLRHTLQLELASRGTYVSFADKRRQKLENKLLNRYGSSLDAMSAEERKTAIEEIYREDRPPARIEQTEQIMADQAGRRAAFEAYRQERADILNDPGLDFEQRQELLLDLSDRFNSPPGS